MTTPQHLFLCNKCQHPFLIQDLAATSQLVSPFEVRIELECPKCHSHELVKFEYAEDGLSVVIIRGTFNDQLDWNSTDQITSKDLICQVIQEDAGQFILQLTIGEQTVYIESLCQYEVIREAQLSNASLYLLRQADVELCHIRVFDGDKSQMPKAEITQSFHKNSHTAFISFLKLLPLGELSPAPLKVSWSHDRLKNKPITIQTERDPEKIIWN